MRQLPPITTSERIALLKARFDEDLTFEDYGLRPAVTAMIAAAGIGVAEVAMFTADLYAQTGNLMDLCDIRKLIYCVIAFIAIRKIDVHPVVFIGASAVVGIVLGF